MVDLIALGVVALLAVALRLHSALGQISDLRSALARAHDEARARRDEADGLRMRLLGRVRPNVWTRDEPGKDLSN